MCHGHVSTPKNQHDYYVLQTHTNRSLKKKRQSWIQRRQLKWVRFHNFPAERVPRDSSATLVSGPLHSEFHTVLASLRSGHLMFPIYKFIQEPTNFHLFSRPVCPSYLRLSNFPYCQVQIVPLRHYILSDFVAESFLIDILLIISLGKCLNLSSSLITLVLGVISLHNQSYIREVYILPWYVGACAPLCKIIRNSIYYFQNLSLCGPRDGMSSQYALTYTPLLSPLRFSSGL